MAGNGSASPFKANVLSNTGCSAFNWKGMVSPRQRNSPAAGWRGPSTRREYSVKASSAQASPWVVSQWASPCWRMSASKSDWTSRLLGWSRIQARRRMAISRDGQSKPSGSTRREVRFVVNNSLAISGGPLACRTASASRALSSVESWPRREKSFSW